MLITIMFTEGADESLNRGDVAAQEQERITEEAERPIKGAQTKKRDPADRGESAEQEQQRY
jgi:hypothetical protein